MDHSVRSSVLLVNIAFICTHRSVLQLKKGNCWKKWQSCLQIQMQERKNWYELLDLVDLIFGGALLLLEIVQIIFKW